MATMATYLKSLILSLISKVIQPIKRALQLLNQNHPTNWCRIGFVSPGHYSQITEIFRESFCTCWTPEMIRSLFRSPTILGRVAISKGRVVGAVIYSKSMDETRVLYLAVACEKRRRSVGSQLIAALLRTEPGAPGRPMRAVLRSNADQSFWRSLGFKAKAIHRGHFKYPNDDGVEMVAKRVAFGAVA